MAFPDALTQEEKRKIGTWVGKLIREGAFPKSYLDNQFLALLWDECRDYYVEEHPTKGERVKNHLRAFQNWIRNHRKYELRDEELRKPVQGDAARRTEDLVNIQDFMRKGIK